MQSFLIPSRSIHAHALPVYKSETFRITVVHISQSMNLHRWTHHHTKSIVYIGFTLGFVHAMDLDKCINDRYSPYGDQPPA